MDFHIEIRLRTYTLKTFSYCGLIVKEF